jgi:ParB/RepB/Spo0J family partition protein
MSQQDLMGMFGGIVEIALDRIDPDPDQPRKHFDEESLEVLARSIKATRLLQPIIVRPVGLDGRYMIVAGERRWRAMKRLGEKTITCLVQQVSDEERLFFQSVENNAREPLRPVEMLQLVTWAAGMGMARKELAERLGIARSHLYRYLTIAGSPEARAALSEGASVHDAYRVARPSDPDDAEFGSDDDSAFDEAGVFDPPATGQSGSSALQRDTAGDPPAVSEAFAAPSASAPAGTGADSVGSARVVLTGAPGADGALAAAPLTGALEGPGGKDARFASPLGFGSSPSPAPRAVGTDERSNVVPFPEDRELDGLEGVENVVAVWAADVRRLRPALDDPAYTRLARLAFELAFELVQEVDNVDFGELMDWARARVWDVRNAGPRPRTRDTHATATTEPAG